MALFNKRTNLKAIEAEIDALLLEMSTTPKDSDEYAKMSENLEQLMKAKGYERSQPREIAEEYGKIALGCILPVVLILKHEEINVIATKAMGFIPKLVK